ncbi:MAG TPA: TIGR02679 family protein, partial [Pseudonocardiaceae bacterium]|nr:TIGR02679 family protein [Pseudonocardiaceae bacterium]
MRQPDTATDLERLHRLLGGDELRWLVERIRTRLERGRTLDGMVALEPASAAQRRAVARLLGRPVGSGASLHVSLPAVEAVLRRGGLAPDLASAVEALTGPVVDRAASRAADAAAWAAALAAAEQALERHLALTPWLEWLRDTGLLRRLAGGGPERARALAEQAVAVLWRLPAGGQPLSVLAASAAGDEHALDPGRPLTTLVLRAAAILGEVPPGDDAEWRRTVWASVGVLTGELTNPVLTLRLPGDLHTVTGRVLAIWSDAGQPVHLTARQLLRDPPDLPVRDRSVFVCENPTVVAEAASKLGARTAPLICANAHPGAAATVLLRQLAAAGARLRYHGDFDWPGITIANGIIGRFGARPWRLDSGAYRSAAALGG